MGLFGRQKTWRALETPQQVGSIILHENGEYSIRGMRFNQAACIEKSSFYGVRLEKQPGNNEILEARKGFRTRFFKYDGADWYILV